jgi:hypothetical protein
MLQVDEIRAYGNLYLTCENAGGFNVFLDRFLSDPVNFRSLILLLSHTHRLT